MTPQELFVTRLRRQRMRARVSLEHIAETLRIKPELMAALENAELSEWPRGLYARAWVRAYATAVDLDPVETVNQFCRLFPQGDRRSGSTIQRIASIVAAPSEYRDEFVHPRGRRSTDHLNVDSKQPWHAFLTQPGRALWSRLTGATPEFEERRASRRAGA